MKSDLAVPTSSTVPPEPNTAKPRTAGSRVLISYCASEVLLDEEIDLDRRRGRRQTPNRLQGIRTDAIDLTFGKVEPATERLSRASPSLSRGFLVPIPARQFLDQLFRCKVALSDLISRSPKCNAPARVGLRQVLQSRHRLTEVVLP